MADEVKPLDRVGSIVHPEFIRGILQKSENDPSIKIIDIKVMFATNKGDNYTSEMFRLIVDYNRNDEPNTARKKQLIIKLALRAEGLAPDAITNSMIFDTEIKMMSDTLEKMNDLLGPENRLNGRCLHVQRGNPLFLVIEDLAPLGFRMVTPKTNLDLDHCLLAIQNLARFHASSVAVCEKEPHLKELYQIGIFSPLLPPETAAFFKGSIRQLANEILIWNEVDPEYSKKLEKLADVFFDRGQAVCAWNPEEFNVINHGDFWTNNMLFKYDGRGKPEKHIFVDFQICNYSSPVLDLLYFFNTSIDDDILLEHESLFLEQYRETLASTMRQMGCSTKPPTVEELKSAMAKRLFVKMFATFIVLPFVLAEKDALFKMEKMCNEDGKVINPGVRHKLFRSIMTRRLREFEELGLLD